MADKKIKRILEIMMKIIIQNLEKSEKRYVLYVKIKI